MPMHYPKAYDLPAYDLPRVLSSSSSCKRAKREYDGDVVRSTPTKKKRTDSMDAMDDVAMAAAMLMCAPEAAIFETPFDLHLQEIYSGAVDANPDGGLAFFESHGYYDVDEANTVEMFRSNFQLEAFWDEDEDDEDLSGFFYQGALTPMALTYRSAHGTTQLTRRRTDSGRFQLLDDEGNEIDDETRLELEREERLKAKSLQLDDDDMAELEHEQIVMVQAVSVIRTETSRFQRYFMEAFSEEDARNRVQARTSIVPQQVVPVHLDLPPYCGNVYTLKDTIPFLLRSWHKRWFYLDFSAGLIMIYKRSYWKSPRGVIDLRDVATVERMGQSDLRVEYTDSQQHPMMMLRCKSAEEAELWVNLLRFAKRQVGDSPAPLQLTQNDASKLKMSLMRKKNKSKVDQRQLMQLLLSNSSSTAMSHGSAA